MFYRRLLPQLKQRGKAVAITHDDRWFDLADRSLQLRAGQRLASGAAAEPRIAQMLDRRPKSVAGATHWA
jgi:putative pyoverdin transport system ATP-binding/permease protein